MQTSWLKDLVCLVDPQHRLTFLNYLVSTGRLYALLNSQFDVIPRQEYMNYLAWASERMAHVHYGTPVDVISYSDGGFTVCSGGRALARSEHLVIGIGTEPYVPPDLAGLPPDQALVADDLAARLDGMTTDLDARVAVVGGGQTGAECVLALLGRGFRTVLWFGRRPWFSPMDDSPPANDFYRPAYQQFLQGVGRPTRRRLIEGQVLTGDAISPGSLRAIYQANYEGMLRIDRFPLTLFPGRDVVAGQQVGAELELRAEGIGGPERHRVAYAVLATGRRPAPVPFDRDLLDRIELDDAGDIVVDADYSVRWKGMNGNRIFALNRARHTHGIPDANLTLLPMRAAIVLNSMFEREVYTVRDDLVSTVWG
jgi:lysine N6-hydroxylase